MGMIIFLVFLGVFAVVALLLIAGGNKEAQRTKQVLARLDSALANESVKTPDQLGNILKSELLSGIPWLNEGLRNLEVAPKLQNFLHQADLKWTAGSLLAMCATGFVFPAYLVNMRFHNLLIALPFGLLFGAAPLLWVNFKRNKRFGKFEQGLPEALDLMTNALRAGHSLIAAMGLVGRECAAPVGSEFRTCFEEQNYGLELKIAMDNMLNRVPIQDLRIVSTAIMIQKESGGNLAEVLNGTSHVIRERFRLKRQVSVHTAQGRMTGWVLTLLPIGLGVGLYIINPEMMSILWTRPIGIKLLWISGGMIVVGGFIINKIVDMDV